MASGQIRRAVRAARELYVQGMDFPSAQVRDNRIVSCTDGDPCDLDRYFRFAAGVPACGDTSCEISVAICVGQTDGALPSCTPLPLGTIRLHVRRLGIPGLDFAPDSIPRRELLSTALPWETRSGPSCGAPITMRVDGRVTKDGRKLPGRLAITVDVPATRGARPVRDRDRFVLECLPRTAPCPDAAEDETCSRRRGCATRIVAMSRRVVPGTERS